MVQQPSHPPEKDMPDTDTSVRLPHVPRRRVRYAVIAMQLGLMLAAILLLGFLALIWRLSQGPIDLAEVSSRIERAINDGQSDYTVAFGATRLVWGTANEPFIVDVSNVQVSTRAGVPVANIKRLGFEAYKRHLVRGTFVPKAITVYAPVMRVMRAQDGRFTFDFDNVAQPVTDDAASDNVMPETDKQAQDTNALADTDLVARLLSTLDHDTAGKRHVLQSLERIRVVDAQGYFSDDLTGVKARIADADIRLARGPQRTMLASFNVSADMDEAPITLNGTAFYNFGTHDAQILTRFDGIDPAKIALQSPKLAEMGRVTSILAGSAELNFIFSAEQFDLRTARLSLKGGAGTIHLPEAYDAPFPVDDFSLVASYTDTPQRVIVRDVIAHLNGDAVFTATAEGARDSEGAWELAAHAEAINAPIDEIGTYWPHKLYPTPRKWVTTRISKGMVPHATVDVKVSGIKDGGGVLENLSGEIYFKDATVNYLPDLFIAEAVDGHATYTAKDITIHTESGKANGVDVKKGYIKLYDDDIAPHVLADIKLSVAGPLRNALQFIDRKPLDFAKDFDVSLDAISGNVTGDIALAFPVHEELTMSEVGIDISATGDGVAIADVVKGLNITAGKMNLSVTEKQLLLKGDAVFNAGAARSPISWTRDFHAEQTAPFDHIVTTFDMDKPFIEGFSGADKLQFAGAIPASIEYKAYQNGRADIVIKGNLMGATFTIPHASYTKPHGQPASLAGMVTLQNGTLSRIDGLKFESADVDVDGAVVFDMTSGDMTDAKISALRIGNTDIQVDTVRADNGLNVHVTGASLDISQFTKDTPPPAGQILPKPAGKAVPLHVTLDVKKVITASDGVLENVILNASRNADRRIDGIRMDARAGGKPLEIVYAPGSDQALRVMAADAGAALRAAGLTGTVQGGRLDILAMPRPGGGAFDLQGRVTMSDFTVVDAPVLARLLNALSLTGILNLLSSDGISFEKAEAGFTFVDRLAVQDGKDIKLLRLNNGRTTGASLGLTFEGAIDRRAKTIDLQGTIVPVSTLNKIVSNIPIVGTILSGNSDAVFAATYTIEGSTSAPEVSVNPLAALAPGIFRKMFFE